MINTRHSTWAGSLFTWQLLVHAEEAPLQGEVVAVETWLWREIALIRNPAHGFCAQTGYNNCDAGVSIYGRQGKATKNGEEVGWFYNYPCDYAEHGGSEVSDPEGGIMVQPVYYSFCCCRKG